MATAYKHKDAWRAQCLIDGKRKGKAGFKTKREAMAWANEQERLAKESASSDIPDRPFSDALTRLAKKVDVLNLAKISGHTDLRILQKVYYAPDMGDIALMLD